MAIMKCWYASRSMHIACCACAEVLTSPVLCSKGSPLDVNSVSLLCSHSLACPAIHVILELRLVESPSTSFPVEAVIGRQRRANRCPVCKSPGGLPRDVPCLPQGNLSFRSGLAGDCGIP